MNDLIEWLKALFALVCALIVIFCAGMVCKIAAVAVAVAVDTSDGLAVLIFMAAIVYLVHYVDEKIDQSPQLKGFPDDWRY